MATFEQLTGRYLDHELRSADSTTLFTTERRQAAINDGAREFADLTECLLVVSSVACSCNVSTYNLLSSAVLGSTGFSRLAARGIEFHHLSSNDQLTQLSGDEQFPRRDIEWLNTHEPGWRQSTTPQIPTGYYVDESNGRFVIGLDHPPDIGSSETATLMVPFIAAHVVMTSSGEEPFTVNGTVRTDLRPFHQATVHYGAHQLWKLKGDEAESDRSYAKFLAYVQRYTEKVRKRGANAVRLARTYLKTRRHGDSDRGSDPYWTWP